jgi:copper(I)-binding protein
MRKFKLLTLLFVAFLITGCGVGPNAFTSQQGPTGDGTYEQINKIYAQNVVIVIDQNSNATLVATLINNSGQEDALIDVVISNPSPQRINFTPEKPINLPMGKRVNFGNAPESAHVDLLNFPAKNSSYVSITLVFENAGALPLNVLTVEPSDIYEGIGPKTTL